MDDRARLRALLAICIDMGHHIVAHHFFTCFRHLIVDVLRVGLQFVDLFLGDGKPQLFFRFRQSNPEFPPRAELFIGGKQELHLSIRIPRGQRRLIRILQIDNLHQSLLIGTQYLFSFEAMEWLGTAAG